VPHDYGHVLEEEILPGLAGAPPQFGNLIADLEARAMSSYPIAHRCAAVVMVGPPLGYPFTGRG
jgi:hypothetical protein